MKLVHLLSTFSGRIGRGSWWLGFAVTIAASIVGSLLIDPGIWRAVPPRAPKALLTLWEIVLTVPATAITVKRFNDRDWPNWLGYAIGAINIVFILAQQSGYLVDDPETAPVREQLAFILLGAVWLFTLIDSGFVKGTSGPNQYGPDPIM